MEIHESKVRARNIPTVHEPAEIRKDLETLREAAVHHGADQAVVISAGELIFDRKSAREPGDESYTSAHWPLHVPLDSMRDALAAYQWGIFFRVHTPTGMRDPGQGPIEDEEVRFLCEKIHVAVTKVESAAFYMGYHLTLGFAHGNCRAVFCHNEKRCFGAVKGRVCLHPYKSRPTMAAAGVDARAMARKQGWQFEDLWTGPLAAGLVMVV